MQVRVCVGAYAEKPYNVPGLEMSVYSMEELCYCFRENAFLLDGSLCDERLADWVEKECGLPQVAEEIRNLIRALSTEHTVIFSSHILSEVQQACTRVLILDEGRLVMNYDTRQPENNVLHLQLSVAGETKQILKQIRSLNGFTDVRELPSAEKGVTEIRAAVTAEDSRGAAMDRAFRALADSGLRIRMIREEREDLEEVFLKSISGAVAEKQR